MTRSASRWWNSSPCNPLRDGATVIVNRTALAVASDSINAAGDPPLDRLQDQWINEDPTAEGLTERFEYRRVVLHDHCADRLPDPAELNSALAALRELRASGPVFVHCVAAMERSPLVCLAWLVSRHGQSPQAALDYTSQVHPGTSSLPGQLQLLQLL